MDMELASARVCALCGGGLTAATRQAVTEAVRTAAGESLVLPAASYIHKACAGALRKTASEKRKAAAEAGPSRSTRRREPAPEPVRRAAGGWCLSSLHEGIELHTGPRMLKPPAPEAVDAGGGGAGTEAGGVADGGGVGGRALDFGAAACCSPPPSAADEQQRKKQPLSAAKHNDGSAIDLRGGGFGVFVCDRQAIALKQATAKDDTVRVNFGKKGVGKLEGAM